MSQAKKPVGSRQGAREVVWKGRPEGETGGGGGRHGDDRCARRVGLRLGPDSHAVLSPIDLDDRGGKEQRPAKAGGQLLGERMQRAGDGILQLVLLIGDAAVVGD